MNEHTTSTTKAETRSLRFGESWDYAPAPESVKVEIAEQYGHYINGKFTAPTQTTKFFSSINPSNEKVLSKLTQGTAKDARL